MMGGGRDWDVRDRKSRSASFEDIIEETAREDLERVWGGGGQRKSIFYLQR